jgi:hypothetical protein
MKIINRKSVMINDMSKFCYLSAPDDYVEVTAYGNGEDAYSISTKECEFHLTKGEVEAILFGIYQINYSDALDN